MKQTINRILCQLVIVVSVLVSALTQTSPAFATDSYCATVEIEIKQELAFERQAFNAQMKINNGLDDLTVKQVKVDVRFTDANGDPVVASSDPEHESAQFFIRIDSLSNIDNVDGTGEIAPNTTAEVNWLIIPAAGVSASSPSGTLYFVGAMLTYQLGDEEKEIEVAPDHIIVKPLPLITLDYFLPRDVYADDSFTPQIEPPVPFTLGVRATNNGYGTAYDLSIDSAQPRIIENELGLIIDFRINDSFVGNEAVKPTLKVNLGDLDSGDVQTARWNMQTTLSGEFVAFEAEFSHADELGGELTSLLEATNAHELVHNVLVDLPGRDDVLDFLAKDGDTLRLYESHGLDNEVTDQSSQASLSLSSQGGGERTYQLTAPSTDGFFYTRMTDPHAGTQMIRSVTRSDGKQISTINSWLSKVRRSDNGWDYFIHLFDSNTSGRYTISMSPRVTTPQPPLLQFIPDRQVVEQSQVAFLVEASDPNGTLPIMSINPIPDGATYESDPNGSEGLSTYVFDWTPSVGQAGSYEIRFIAADESTQTEQLVRLTVCPLTDTDCDGMDDAWEIEHFGSLDRDGRGDYDGDGHSDLDEFLRQSNPVEKNAPTVPVIIAPDEATENVGSNPNLIVTNSIHAPNVEIYYDYEVYSDEGLTELLGSARVNEQVDQTVWETSLDLAENAWFYWRVRACDPILCSEWANARFQVDTVNEPPTPFSLSSPLNNSEVNLAQPRLVLANSSDPEGEAVTYRFVLYSDTTDPVVVAQSDSLAQGDNGETAWIVDVPLEENQRYRWQATAEDPSGLQRSSETWNLLVNQVNSAPSGPVLLNPTSGQTVEGLVVELQIENAYDPDSTQFSYLFEIDIADTFDSNQKRTVSIDHDPVGSTTTWLVEDLQENTRYYWRVLADDGAAQSAWNMRSFFVNMANDPPAMPTINNPGDGAWIETRRPTFSLHPSTDPDSELVSYQYELSTSDASYLAGEVTNETEWPLSFELDDNNWYQWRAKALDDLGAESDWTGWSRFFVNDNGVNDAPEISLLEPQTDITLVSGATISLRWEDDDPDSSARVSLYYQDEAVGAQPVILATDIEEDLEGAHDEFVWDTSQLEPGIYQLFATIEDEVNQTTAYANGKITIPEPAPEGSLSVVTLTPTVTTEAGGVASFTVALAAMPTAEVEVELNTTNFNEGQLSNAILVFNSANWDIPQQIDVIGQDDCASDGDVTYQINGLVVSDDPAYSGISGFSLDMSNQDNEQPGSSLTYSICNWDLISTTRVGRTEFEYEYRVQLTNSGDVVTNLTATVSTNQSQITLIDPILNFEAIDSGATVDSVDTIRLRVDRRYSIDHDAIEWEISE